MSRIQNKRNKQNKRGERPLPGIVLGACAMLLIGFASVWFYLQYAERQRLASSYTMLERVAIGRDGHSIRASIAIQTSDADLRWALRNREGIEVAFQQALLALDPQRIRAPGALHAFQQELDETLNRTLKTDKIQQVLLTDFLLSEGDY